MTKREETYLDNFYNKFSALLDEFLKSEVVDWDDKEIILDNLKEVIDYRIRELHSGDGVS